jgi:NitT/TauT family transport system permease protein/sulfonate transport system permease protein
MQARGRSMARLVAEGGVIAALVGWWAMAQGFPDYVLPGPAATAARAVELFRDEGLAWDIAVTTVRVAISILAAMVLGTALALLPRYVPATRSTVSDRIQPFFNSFPAIGWVLLATIWFNVSSFTVIFVQVAILLPFCLVNVGEGVRTIDEEMIEMGRSFAAGPRRLFVSVVLPLLAPYLFAALRISYGVAWKIGLVSELFGARSGVGFAMLRAQTYADTAGVLAICLIVVALFILGDRLAIRPLGRRFAAVTV